jgi:hypothetical protein
MKRVDVMWWQLTTNTIEKPGVFRTKSWMPVTYWTIPDSERKLQAWVGVNQNSNCQSNSHIVTLVSRYKLSEHAIQ